MGRTFGGFLEGGDPTLKDELVVITGYYDSMSVVPAMAPGADSYRRHRHTVGTCSHLQPRGIPTGAFPSVCRNRCPLPRIGGYARIYGRDWSRYRRTRSGFSPALRQCAGCVRGLSTDLFEFEELGRKLLLSIDRNVLVDLPPNFFHDVHELKADVASLATTLSDLQTTKGNIDSLRNAQREAKEKEKKKLETTKKREKQGFTEEEKSRLEVNLAKFKKDALQTTQFLRSMLNRTLKLRTQALAECRDTQRELIEQIALPMARLDVWAIDKLEADLKAKRIEGKYVQTPDSSYLTPQEREEGSYYLPVPSDLPSYLEVDVQRLSENLQDWEFEDPRKFTLQYAQEKLLDRHLDFKGLERIKSARRVVNRAEKSLEAYIGEERQLLERTLADIPVSSDAEDSIKNAITQLSSKPDHLPEDFADELKLFLNEATLKQFEIVQTQLHQKLEMIDPTTGTATSRELDQIFG